VLYFKQDLVAVMDVFLRNLPADLTDQGLKGQLIRFTKALNIYDWSCQKPRSKSFGFITFLHPQDGEKFLRHHGQNRSLGKSKSGMGLEILGTKIYCKCSNRDPDQYLLKSLTKSAEDRYQENQCVPDFY
jgi:hypothetical protein